MKGSTRRGVVARQHSRYPNSRGLRRVVALPGRKIRTGPGTPGRHMWGARCRNYVWTPDRSDRRNKALGRSAR